MGRARSRSARVGLAFAAPTMAGTAVFLVLPLGALVWLATQRWDLLSPPVPAGAGPILDAITDPAFVRSLATTASIGLPALAVELGVGLALGFALAARLPGWRVARAAVLVPWLIAPFTAGLLARWLTAPSSGLLAQALGRRVDLLDSPVAAPLVVAALVAWQGTGFAAVVLAGAISALPSDVVAAARVDGASSLRLLRSVQLPLLVPALRFLLITGVVQMLGLYDQLVPLTGGGPGDATTTVAASIVAVAWGAGDFGGGAARALLLGAAALLAVGAIAAVLRRRT